MKYVFCLLLTQKFKITMQIIYLKPNLTKIFMNKKFITKRIYLRFNSNKDLTYLPAAPLYGFIPHFYSIQLNISRFSQCNGEINP